MTQEWRKNWNALLVENNEALGTCRILFLDKKSYYLKSRRLLSIESAMRAAYELDAFAFHSLSLELEYFMSMIVLL